MVVWQDIDNMVYGWNMNADDEFGLGLVVMKIAEVKRKKLIHIVEGSNGKSGKKN